MAAFIIFFSTELLKVTIPDAVIGDTTTHMKHQTPLRSPVILQQCDLSGIVSLTSRIRTV